MYDSQNNAYSSTSNGVYSSRKNLLRGPAAILNDKINISDCTPQNFIFLINGKNDKVMFNYYDPTQSNYYDMKKYCTKDDPLIYIKSMFDNLSINQNCLVITINFVLINVVFICLINMSRYLK